jgi:hypothetical protein
MSYVHSRQAGCLLMRPPAQPSDVGRCCVEEREGEREKRRGV